MAPNINPKPQLKRLTIIVLKVIIADVFDVVVQYLVIKVRKPDIGLDNAKTCPKTSISIIWKAKYNPPPVLFHNPDSQCPNNLSE